MSNLDLWNKVKQPPVSALKQIQGGRLKGMTDINPQWRIEAMTEHFGPCGIGWHYEIVRLWTENGADGELMAFAHVHLFTHYKGNTSEPIVGIGGSALVAKERDGLRANDEGYKMAVTDALSVAMKQLGFGADIYMGRFDGSEYKPEQMKVSAARIQELIDQINNLEGDAKKNAYKFAMNECSQAGDLDAARQVKEGVAK
jgi:hypothetical protein